MGSLRRLTVQLMFAAVAVLLSIVLFAALAAAAAGTVSGTSISSNEGAPFSGDVATYTGDCSPVACTALVDWGDGSPATAGTVTGTPGAFHIAGTHTYAQDGSYTTTVTVTDNGSSPAGTGTAAVAEADLVASALPVNATEGQAFTGGVGTFSDPGTTDTVVAFTASIDWGDGTTSAGTVTTTGGGAFQVGGTHTYADELSGQVTLSISETGASSSPVAVVSAAAVGEGDVVTPSQVAINATEGTAFNGAVLTFSDAGNPSSTAADWTATIDWGDGTPPTGGTVTGTPAVFTIAGSHSYTDEGIFTLTVTAADDTPGTFQISRNVTVNVNEGDTLSGLLSAATPAEGVAFSGEVATFTDTNSSASPADMLVTIDWGDGTITAGTVTGGGGAFAVAGTHTYAADGSYPVSVSLLDDAFGTAMGTANGHIVVREGAFVLNSVAPITVAEGTIFSGEVAGFIDLGASDPASNFIATIDWGDGTTSAGVVTALGLRSYTVTGAHTYADEMDGFINVTVQEPEGAFSIGPNPGVVAVVEADSLSGTLAGLSPTSGLPFSGQLATFTDTYGAAPVSDFSASVDWGDGTTSVGTVSGPTGGPFTVSGSHTYAVEGAHTVGVTLSDDAPGTASATATGTVDVAEAVGGEGAFAFNAVAPVSVPEGTVFSGTVAAFTDVGANDPAGNFVATIDWGDGTSGAGVVSALGGGSYAVSGSHTYADEMIGAINVTVQEAEAGFSIGPSPVALAVVEGDGLSGSGTTIISPTGAVSGTLATFTDTYAAAAASDFNASIDWGDGTVGAGTIAGPSGGPFTVGGIHTYSARGAHTVTITFSDDAPGTASATASTTVILSVPPTISKAFGAASIPLGGLTSLTFTITNPNTASDLTGVGFADALPGGLVVSSPDGLSGSCGGGAIAASSGTSLISLTGATLLASGSCTFSVNVTGTSAGVQNNISGSVTSNEGGAGGTASASITVVAPPALVKAFGAGSIPLGGQATLSFTASNPNSSTTLTGVGFSDSLPAGLVVSTPNGLVGSCGGGAIAATAGGTVVSLSGASLGPGASCTFAVSVTGTTAGDQANTTGAIASNEGGAGATASATVTVVAPPVIVKAFNPAAVSLNATSALTFTITNPAGNTVALAGVGFTDSLPGGVTVGSGSAAICGGTLTTTAPDNITLAGATIAAGGACTFSVTVSASLAGAAINTTGPVTSSNGGTGNMATATLTVIANGTTLTITRIFALDTEDRQALAIVTFSDSDRSATVSQFSGTVDWGDGQVSSVRCLFNPVWGFVAFGTHQYAHDGTYVVTVTIRDSQGASASRTTTVEIGVAGGEGGGGDGGRDPR